MRTSPAPHSHRLSLRDPSHPPTVPSSLPARPSLVPSRPRSHRRSQVHFIASFHSASFPDSLAIAKGGGLALGSVDEIQKLHVRTVALGEQPRRIAHQDASRTFAVTCTQANINLAGAASGGRGLGAGCVLERCLGCQGLGCQGLGARRVWGCQARRAAPPWLPLLGTPLRCAVASCAALTPPRAPSARRHSSPRKCPPRLPWLQRAVTACACWTSRLLSCWTACSCSSTSWPAACAGVAGRAVWGRAAGCEAAA